MKRPNKQDYEFSSIGTCYVHKETGELWEDHISEYIDHLQSELEKVKEERDKWRIAAKEQGLEVGYLKSELEKVKEWLENFHDFYDAHGINESDIEQFVAEAKVLHKNLTKNQES